EAHGAGHAFDSRVRLAERDFCPAAEQPRPRQVRIQLKGALDQGIAVFDISCDVAKRKPGRTEPDCILGAHLCRPPGEPSRLSYLVRAIGRPTTGVTLNISAC